MIRLLFISCLLIGTITAIAQSTLESIPNQKLINGSYVSNPDKILDEATITEIDTLLKSLEKKTSVQVAVVAVESIGNENIFDFAQQLYTAWGIGNNDNGLLVLLVKDQRTVRFHTGYGVEGVLPDVVCKRIQRDHMVPAFKREYYSAGILEGVKEVVKILTTSAAVEELKQPEDAEVSNWVGFVTFLAILFVPAWLIIYIIKARKGRFKDSKRPEETPYPEMRTTRLGWLFVFVVMPILIVIACGSGITGDPTGPLVLFLYFYFMTTLLYRLWRERTVINRFLKVQNYYEIVEFLRKQQWYWLFMGIIFPLPFFPYFFYYLSRKKRYRNHPRKCKACRGKMIKLTESTEDEYLSEEQKMEESLKSVDYDVWKCEACEGVDMWFYLNRNSGFQVCPKCSTIAFHHVESITIERATYTKGGSGEDISACQFCGHKVKKRFTTPKRERSTSSASSFGSSGSSFGGGSSSSSSGGSWGGGRSGGGGASSSW